MAKKCKRGDQIVVRNLEEIPIFQSIMQKIHVGDYCICPFAILEVWSLQGYSFLTSARRLEVFKGRYFARSPFTGEMVFLTSNNFKFRCKKEGLKINCPETFTSIFEKNEDG